MWDPPVPPFYKALLNADAIMQINPHKGLNMREGWEKSGRFLTPISKLICTFKLKTSMSGHTLS